MKDQSFERPQVEYRHITLRCILVLVAACGLVLGTFYPALGTASYGGLVGVLALITAIVLLAIQGRWRGLAAWLVVLGGVVATGVVWRFYPWAGMPTILVFPVIVGAAVLGLWGSLAAALLASALLIGASSGALQLPIERGAFLAATLMVWASFIVTALMTWQQSASIASALEGYNQARNSLAQARDRQLELNQALTDLDLAHRELIRLNDLLKAAREAVEAARRAKEEFVAGVSHELRTPLNMIIGFSDEILERPQVYSPNLPAELLEHIGVIKRNSEQLARLVDDVLDLVEADAGFTRLVREWTSIDDVVRDAVEAVRPFFETKGLTLTMKTEPDLPQLYCDPTRIRQVVLNVLSNAARFTEHGGAEVCVSRDEDDFVVSVADTGPGMDPAIVDRMLEPFQQADPSLRRRYGGTGLGLAISKRMVEMHGGEIWIESQMDVGTTVLFSLPAKPAPVKVPASGRWFSPYHDFSYQVRDRRSAVAIADPDPSIAVVEKGTHLAHLLGHHMAGWEVKSLPSLGAAASAVGAGGPKAVVVNDLILAARPEPDLALPRMDLDVPIIYCWAPANDDMTAHMGVASYLTKPVRRDELVQAIESASPGAGRVLIVDDDEDARHLFGQMLASAQRGYQVAHAIDGAEALDLMGTWQPDVVLLDLLLPNVDGFSVLAARAANAELRDIPIVIVSARDQRQDQVVSTALILTRQGGLSARDLASAIEALVGALLPRFGSPAPRENRAP